MPYYTYPQPMYRSDGALFTCNSDSDVDNLPTTPTTAWSAIPWSPAGYTSSQAQTDYVALQASNALLQAEVAALQAQVASADQALTQTGL